MASGPCDSFIRLRGVRQNNLKGFNLDLPKNKLIVITGLSGSGKSSLAFDTLFAEGQRRYIETFSPYARQFFDRMDKPRVDSIEGIPPAIAIEQRNSVRTSRSTVGTMTEICDFMKVIWPRVAQLHCRGCSQPVRKDSPQEIWQIVRTRLSSLNSDLAGGDVLITFEIPLSARLTMEESLSLLAKQGYQRLLIDGKAVRTDEAPAHISKSSTLTVIQDRVRVVDKNRSRFIEACEQAHHFGKGRLAVHLPAPTSDLLKFSTHLHCASCDIEYREPSAALFSFNNPAGACPGCKGFGRIITIDYHLAIPDRRISLADGAIKPWQTGQGAECQRDLKKFCRARNVPMDIPFESLSAEQQKWVIDGDEGYGKDAATTWPHAWYGIRGYFRWLESKAYKMHVRVLLSRYRAYTRCPDCHGKRLQPDALLYRISAGQDHPIGSESLTLTDFYGLPLETSLQAIKALAASRTGSTRDPVSVALREVSGRIGFMVEMGLGHLTLDRNTRSLSGGETERVNLTTCLGAGLVHALYVLDEPSVGLHARDTDRLVSVLERLRDAGNTVVVVEHESAIIKAADMVVDLGPRQGEQGGELMYQGRLEGLIACKESLTGQYLGGQKGISRISPPQQPEAGITRRWLKLSGATLHNLSDVSVSIPLNQLVCITGVSGSGKTTLIRELLLPMLQSHLGGPSEPADGGESDDETTHGRHTGKSHTMLEGWESLGSVVMVDQASLGRTPRSNPAVYIGAFELIRDFFAKSEEAKAVGLQPGHFSFNSVLGQCERCKGAGFEKIEMQFLSDIFVKCPACDGRRYRENILAVKIHAKGPGASRPAWSVGDLLDAPVRDAITFMECFPGSRPASKAIQRLRWLEDVGLGYLRLGQPINTLSGGECQRLKLVKHLVDSGPVETTATAKDRTATSKGKTHPGKPTLFLFDEPTTGLHFDDVQSLLNVLHRLVQEGHSVLVIEHQLDVIRCSDWIIDLGPEAGARGGHVVVCGPPDAIMRCSASHTGQALAVLQDCRRTTRR